MQYDCSKKCLCVYVCARTHTGRRRQQQPLVHEQQDEWEGRNERWNHGKGLVVSIASKRVGFIRKNVGVRNCEFAWNWVKSSGVIEIFLDFKMSNAPFLDATIQLYTQVFFCPCNAAVFKLRTKKARKECVPCIACVSESFALLSQFNHGIRSNCK